MRDRKEAHDGQDAMEELSLGPRATPVTPKHAGPGLRCPSCNHANPGGSSFCNQCGMPVHFETCGRCEAINLRGAAQCHKCGCVRPGSATLASTPPAPDVVLIPSTQAPPLRDPDTEAPPEVFDAPQPRRHGGMWAASIASVIVLVGVPTYIATEHPATFQRAVDAIAPRGNVAAVPPAQPSPPVEPSAVTPAEPLTAQSVPPAMAAEAASAASQDASAPPSETARDYKDPGAAPSAAVAPPVAKSSRTTTTKSNTARSKQGTSSRKAPARKPATKKP